MDIVQKLKIFEEASLNASKALVEQELNSLKAELEAELASYEAAKTLEMQKRLSLAKAKIKSELSKKYSSKNQHFKNTVTKRLQAIRRMAFEEAMLKIRQHKLSPAYVNEMNDVIRYVEEIAGGKHVVIYINSDDEHLKGQLVVSDSSSIVTAPADIIGGLKALVESEHMIIDKSYLKAVEDCRNSFYYEIGDGIVI